MWTYPSLSPGLACVMQDLKLLSFNVQWFRDLGASFSSFGVLRFRVLGAPFKSFGCFVFRRFGVLRASVFVFRNYLSDILEKTCLVKGKRKGRSK